MQIIKNIIKYAIFLLIGAFLLKQSYKGFEIKEIWTGIKRSDYFWLILASGFNIGSHIFRAMRWKLLLESISYPSSILNTLISDLSGLFANLFLPRLGEIFRCTALKRLNKTPISSSLPTVIVERFMDVVIFIGLFCITAFILKDQMFGFLSLFNPVEMMPNSNQIIIIGSIIFIIVSLSFILKKHLMRYYDIVLKEIKNALDLSKDMLKNSNKGLILFHTIWVWVFYLLSMYLVLFAVKATSHLRLDAGLIILIVSSLGLAAPVQGSGAGAMHILVASALSIFYIDKPNAILVATLIHGVQFLTALLFGGISMILSFVCSKRL